MLCPMSTVCLSVWIKIEFVFGIEVIHAAYPTLHWREFRYLQNNWSLFKTLVLEKFRQVTSTVASVVSLVRPTSNPVHFCVQNDGSIQRVVWVRLRHMNWNFVEYVMFKTVANMPVWNLLSYSENKELCRLTGVVLSVKRILKYTWAKSRGAYTATCVHKSPCCQWFDLQWIVVTRSHPEMVGDMRF